MTRTTNETLSVGDLDFEVRRSNRRRSVQITVDRGGELVLSAPEDLPTSAMTNFVQDKKSWIYTKLAEKESLRPRGTEKQYVSGEGFVYLGRSYRLLLVPEQEAPVKLEQGRFKMRRSAATEGRDHMVAWYTDHAQPWLKKRVQRWQSRVAVEPSAVVVQDLGYRWGSCGKGSKLYFHWRTILLPPPMIEYVIVHELAHLREPHHTQAFWAILERSMPDFAQRRESLRQRGSHAAAL